MVPTPNATLAFSRYHLVPGEHDHHEVIIRHEHDCLCYLLSGYMFRFGHLTGGVDAGVGIDPMLEPVLPQICPNSLCRQVTSFLDPVIPPYMSASVETRAQSHMPGSSPPQGLFLYLPPHGQDCRFGSRLSHLTLLADHLSRYLYVTTPSKWGLWPLEDSDRFGVRS